MANDLSGLPKPDYETLEAARGVARISTPTNTAAPPLPPPFRYVDQKAVTEAHWTPIESITLKDGREVIVCAPGRAFFHRKDCVNKWR